MKNYTIFFALLFCIISSLQSFLHAMDIEKKQPHLVIIPGQNGLGGFYAQELLQMADDHVNHAGTPSIWMDLGQKTCVSHCAKTLLPLQRSDTIEDIIIHASSQGSATAFNYVADTPNKIKMMIIESMLASGNSAIHHTITKNVVNLPGSYYMLPYLAKIFSFWSYVPTGMQAIHAVDKIPNTMPIVFVHCKYDFQLAFSDAEAMYARLRQQGNGNVYLIPIDKRGHVELVHSGSDNAQVIRAILHKHKLGDVPAENIDLSKYQPEPNIEAYNQLITREQRLRYFDVGIKSISIAGLATIITRYFNVI